MAVDAGYFKVPLFSHIVGRLWTGCSPAEFPDEMEPVGYDPLAASQHRIRSIADPVQCHWLWEDVGREQEAQAHMTAYGGEIRALRGPEIVREPRFGVILNLYPWAKYVVPEGVEYREVEMYDSHGLPDVQQVQELARWVNVKQIEQTGNVLVHCQAGLNRSSLIAAASLVVAGFSPDAAINLIREKRCSTCLCNRDFERFIRGFNGS